MKNIKLLVTGGREYNDVAHQHFRMDKLHAKYGIKLVIHGACCKYKQPCALRGADHFAQEWAQINEIAYIGLPAPWKKLGKAAGMVRNAEMLKRFKPNLVLAMPGGTGTANMKKLAKDAGIKIIEG